MYLRLRVKLQLLFQILIKFEFVECIRSDTVRHNTSIFVIQCYIVQFNDSSLGITFKKIKKKNINEGMPVDGLLN
jgi:hypothetical protein